MMRKTGSRIKLNRDAFQIIKALPQQTQASVINQGSKTRSEAVKCGKVHDSPSWGCEKTAVGPETIEIVSRNSRGCQTLHSVTPTPSLSNFTGDVHQEPTGDAVEETLLPSGYDQGIALLKYRNDRCGVPADGKVKVMDHRHKRPHTRSQCGLQNEQSLQVPLGQQSTICCSLRYSVCLANDAYEKRQNNERHTQTTAKSGEMSYFLSGNVSVKSGVRTCLCDYGMQQSPVCVSPQVKRGRDRPPKIGRDCKCAVLSIEQEHPPVKSNKLHQTQPRRGRGRGRKVKVGDIGKLQGQTRRVLGTVFGKIEAQAGKCRDVCNNLNEQEAKHAVKTRMVVPGAPTIDWKGELGRHPRLSSQLGSDQHIRRSMKNLCCSLCGDVKYTPHSSTKLDSLHKRNPHSGHPSQTDRQAQTELYSPAKGQPPTKLQVRLTKYPKVKLCDVARVFDVSSRDFSCVLPVELWQKKQPKKRSEKKARCLKKEFLAMTCLGNGCLGGRALRQSKDVSITTNGFASLSGQQDCPQMPEGLAEDAGSQVPSRQGRTKLSLTNNGPADPSHSKGTQQQLANSAENDNSRRSGAACLEKGPTVSEGGVFQSGRRVPPLVLRRVCFWNGSEDVARFHRTDSDGALQTDEPACGKMEPPVCLGEESGVDESEDEVYPPDCLSCQRTQAYTSRPRTSCARTNTSWPFPRRSTPPVVKSSSCSRPLWVVSSSLVDAVEDKSNNCDAQGLCRSLVSSEPETLKCEGNGLCLRPIQSGDRNGTIGTERPAYSCDVNETVSAPFCEKAQSDASELGKHYKYRPYKTLISTLGSFAREDQECTSNARDSSKSLRDVADSGPKSKSVDLWSSAHAVDQQNGGSVVSSSETSAKDKPIESHFTPISAPVGGSNSPKLKSTKLGSTAIDKSVRASLTRCQKVKNNAVGENSKTPLLSETQRSSFMVREREEPSCGNTPSKSEGCCGNALLSSPLCATERRKRRVRFDSLSSTSSEEEEEDDVSTLSVEDFSEDVTDEGMPPADDVICKTNDASPSHSSSLAADGHKCPLGEDGNCLDPAQAYEEDAIVLDVIQDDPELFGSIVDNVASKCGNSDTATKGVVFYTVEKVCPVKNHQRIVWDLEHVSNSRIIKKEPIDKISPKKKGDGRFAQTSRAGLMQSKSFPPVNASVKSLQGEADCNNNQWNKEEHCAEPGRSAQAVPDEKVPSSGQTLLKQNTHVNGRTTPLKDAATPRFQARRTQYCWYHFSEHHCCTRNTCWFQHVLKDGDEKLCMDTVQRFCQTGSPVIVKRAVDMFTEYYSSSSPGESFSQQVVDSLVCSLLNLSFLSDVVSVFSILITHNRLPPAEVLLVLFGRAHERGLLKSVPELILLASRVVDTGCVFSVEQCEMMQTQLELLKVPRQQMDAFLSVKSKVLAANPLVQDVMNIEICKQQEDWTGLGTIFSSVCASHHSASEFMHFCRCIVMALLKEPKDKLTLPYRPFAESVCQQAACGGLVESFLGRTGVSLLLRYHRMSQWTKGVKLVEVMSQLHFGYSMLKGLLDSEDGASRCRLITVATEMFLNSGSVEGALNVLRAEKWFVSSSAWPCEPADLFSRRRLLMLLSKKTSHRDTFDVLSNLPGLGQPIDGVQVEDFTELFNTQLQVCVEKQVLTVAADTLDFMLVRDLVPETSLLKNIVHKLGKQSNWSRARAIFKSARSAGHYAEVQFEDGALWLPCSLSEIEMTLAFEMFITHHLMNQAPGDPAQPLNIILKRGPVGQRVSESEYLAAGCRVLSTAFIPNPKLSIRYTAVNQSQEQLFHLDLGSALKWASHNKGWAQELWGS